MLKVTANSFKLFVVFLFGMLLINIWHYRIKEIG